MWSDYYSTTPKTKPPQGIDTQTIYFLPKVHKDPLNLDLLFHVQMAPPKHPWHFLINYYNHI